MTYKTLFVRQLNPRLFFLAKFAMLSFLFVGCAKEEKPNKPSTVSPSASAKLNRETWDVCRIDGKRVGYSNVRSYDDQLNGQPMRRIEMLSEMEVNRSGNPVKLKIRSTNFETCDGKLLHFEIDVDLGPQKRHTSGRVVGKQLQWETVEGGGKTASKISWSPEYGGPLAPLDSLLHKPMQPGERRSLEYFSFEILQMVTLELRAGTTEKVELPGGAKELLHIDAVTILKNNQKNSDIFWADEKGDVLKSWFSSMKKVEYSRTTREIALTRDTNQAFDINLELAVKLDRPIPNPMKTKKIRYRLRVEDGDPAKIFSAGPTQQMRSIDANTVEMTVFSIRPGNTDGNADAAADPPGDGDRQPCGKIESNDPRVVSLAEKAAEKETDPWQTAVRLEKFVRNHITKKNLSQVFDSAAGVAKSREGDCTEHAVLLAAMCRARKIPARVAIGLVYILHNEKNVPSPKFDFHMWTEAWIDGRWIPLDGTVGRGGISASYLKVFHSNLQEDIYSCILPVAQVAGKLKVEVLEVE
jgi:hypothetical protein